MKVLILYRPQSEHATPTESFIRDFQRNHPMAPVETMDIDSREGVNRATVYDIVAYPAIMVTQEDGSVLQLWQGEPLPMMSDVAAYVLM